MSGDHKKKILVVDDDITILSAVKTILTRAHYLVEGTRSEEMAKQLLFKDNPNAEPDFDLVLLDIKLGPSSGLTLLQNIRDKGSLIPVLIISGSTEADTVKKAANMNVQGFIVKPFKPEALVEKVKACLDANARPKP
jgi:DNA-binding response OmpR family regulator